MMSVSARLLRDTAATLLALLFAGKLAAQVPLAHLIVAVSDSAGAPVSDADVELRRDQTTIARFKSGNDGTHGFDVTPVRGTFTLAVRRLGFAPLEHVVALRAGDTTTVRLTMIRSAAMLSPLVVSAEQSARQRAYTIGSDQIASSTRPLFDVNDIIHKLRPDIWRSRAPEVCDGRSAASPWPAVSNVIVNGQRMPVIKQYVRGKPDGAWVRQQVTEILQTIKPEHVAELHYADCFASRSAEEEENTLYIVLKPGIAFRFGKGSSAQPLRAETSTPGQRVEPDARKLSYRDRLLGVFDAETGAWLEKVSVRDDSTGTAAFTQTGGAVSLWFLPAGTSRVRVSKAGYRDTTLTISISPADTIPVTLPLVPLRRP